MRLFPSAEIFFQIYHCFSTCFVTILVLLRSVCDQNPRSDMPCVTVTKQGKVTKLKGAVTCDIVVLQTRTVLHMI